MRPSFWAWMGKAHGRGLPKWGVPIMNVPHNCFEGAQEEEIPRAVTALLRSSQGYVAGGEPHPRPLNCLAGIVRALPSALIPASLLEALIGCQL